MSGKKKQNTIKATAVSDGDGRLLWLGAFRPGRMHDVTALRTDGIEDLLRRYPDVKAEVDAGYQGLARDFPAQVSAPPKKPGKNAPPEETASWEQRRHRQSSGRICIEHAIAEPKQWRPLQRWTSDAASTSRKPPWPSPGWSPTAPPPGNQPPASPPGQHAPAPIVHLLVSARRLLTRLFRFRHGRDALAGGVRGDVGECVEAGCGRSGGGEPVLVQ